MTPRARYQVPVRYSYYICFFVELPNEHLQWITLLFMINSILQATQPEAKAKPLGPVKRIYCRQNAVRAVRYNADGQYCLTAGGNRSIKLWNPSVGRLLKTYTGHGGEVSDVQVGLTSRLAFTLDYCYVC